MRNHLKKPILKIKKMKKNKFETFKKLFIYPHEDEDVGLTAIIMLLTIPSLNGLMVRSIFFPILGSFWGVMIGTLISYIILWMIYRSIQNVYFWWRWKK